MSDDPRITHASPQQVRDWQSQGDILLIDVREPEEFAAARLPGALLYPLSSFDAQALPAVGPRIVLHCGSGKRSLTAAAKLLEAGRAEATHLAGGLAAWRAAGLPVVP